MTLKIIGSSFKKEFVTCDQCHKEFVWLNAYQMHGYSYYARCSKCRKELGKK